MRRLVPIETLAPYLLFDALAPPALATGLVGLAAGALATLLVTWWHARATATTALLGEHLLRVLSFIAWAFATTNPLAPEQHVPREIPAIALVAIPVLGAIIVPPDRRALD
jgi:hypothetical protein